jgi:hypothetical protein
LSLTYIQKLREDLLQKTYLLQNVGNRRMNYRRGAEASVRTSPELCHQLEDSERRRRRKVLTIQDYSFGCHLLYLLFLDCCFSLLPNLWKLSENLGWKYTENSFCLKRGEENFAKDLCLLPQSVKSSKTAPR